MEIKIPLQQHVGAPNRPIVKEGDEVKTGQLIAKPEGLGANIHSSVDGIIGQVSEKFIIIEAHQEQPDDYIKLQESNDKLKLIEEAGVVGAGGAGFPTHVKLDVNLDGGCVIANGAECEPLLAHNVKLMEENPDVVIQGLRYIKEITNASKGYIAIKPKYQKAVRALKIAAASDNDIDVKLLPDMYPSGDERVVIRELLGIELEPGQLPLEANAVVQNVETLKHIVNAIEKRKPYITKDLTVAGRVKGAIDGKVYMDVPLGEPVEKYIELSGGYIEPHGEIVLGGPFTGTHGDEQSPVTKTLGGIIVAMPFPEEYDEIGLLTCECGADEERMREIAQAMGAKVVAVERCKRMKEINGRYRCDKPGVCPGQAEKVLALKNEGAKKLLISTCGD